MSRLRSHEWLRGRDELGFQHRSALRLLGLDLDGYRGEPVVGIANAWSELSPCDATLRMAAEAVKAGVRKAGAIPLEFPVMGLSEDLLKPSALLHRNLAAMEFREVEKALACGPGACNVMGTASTMAALDEALGMMPAGFSTRPAAAPERYAAARGPASGSSRWSARTCGRRASSPPPRSTTRSASSSPSAGRRTR